MIEEARRLDESDPLKGFRERFVPHEPGVIYLDGNSLGRMPLAAAERLRRFEHEWGERLIRGWNDGWLGLASRVGDAIAPLIGAEGGEVIVADSTSVNLHKAAVAAHRIQTGRGRTRIVSDRSNFPSDLHILADIAPLDLVDGPADLAAAITEETALVSLSHVQFVSGELYDLAGITALARDRGAMTLWDLSHAAGAVPVGLSAAGADLAVGCGYKHLNGGPGAPAFLYVRRELQERLRPPLPGWLGSREPFAFGPTWEPAAGIARFVTGTPPVLSLAALECGVALAAEAGIAAIRAKSLGLGEALVASFDRLLAPRGFSLASPREGARRGSHVTLRHERAWPITQALVASGVIPDFRAPDGVRFGLSALSNSFEEVARAVEVLVRIVDAEEWRAFSEARRGVT